MISNNEKKLFVDNVDLNKLHNKTLLITGATGLIGSYLIEQLIHYNLVKDGNIKIIGVSRNITKLEERFERYSFLEFIQGDVSENITIPQDVDYIIHAASNANPKNFDNDPIGTIKANVYGTINYLELAKLKNVKNFVYLSSSEVYGEPYKKGTNYTEEDMGVVFPTKLRSCYTESKRMAENISLNYSKQYDVPVNIVRIAFAYGGTYLPTDDRVIPQFLNNALNDEDIILKSNGSLVRSYIYVYDVITAMLKVLLEGEKNEVYNVSNKNSNISIRDIAETIAKICDVQLQFDLPENEQAQGYAPFSQALLDSTKLEKIGWSPIYTFEEGINEVIMSKKILSLNKKHKAR